MNYEETRYYLFTKSYIAFKIRQFIKKKYSIPENISSTEWLKFIKENYWKQIEIFCERKRIDLKKINDMYGFIWTISDQIEDMVFPNIREVSDKLHINHKLFKIFIIYNNVPKKLSGPRQIYKVYGELNSISERGVYIKVFKNTTTREIYKLLKEARLQFLVDEFLQNRKDIPSFFDKSIMYEKKRKQISSSDKYKRLAYIMVEGEIINESNNKGNKVDEWGNLTEVTQDTVRLATEKVAGKLIEDGLSDEIFDKTLAEYFDQVQSYHYQVASRYKLPTYKKLNSILRVMTS